MRIFLFVVTFLVFSSSLLHAQDYAQFNLLLDMNLASAAQAVDLYSGQGGRPEDIVHLRGSRLALAITEFLARRPLGSALLQSELEAIKFNQGVSDDVFHLRDARSTAPLIRELLVELNRRNFAQKVVSTIEQLFPPTARLSTTIPIYFVAFGHENIDAYVLRVKWHGDDPEFLREGEEGGQVVAVVNLAKAVNYGRTVDERFLGMMSVVAHEIFHAAFGLYKDQSPFWRDYYRTHRTPFDALLDLAHNEGIAYYLSLIQQSRGRLTPDWEDRARVAFAVFDRNADILLSPRTTPEEADDIVARANTSGYWESYGAIAGMIVARQIDRTEGRAALVQTIDQGPGAFFHKYVEIMRRDTNVPQLSETFVQELNRRYP